jgi:RNA-directed DNA polymerase
MVSRQGRLVMGAPSSPGLTNAMMHDLDSKIASIAYDRHAIYTRYADDLFLSSNVAGQSDLLRDRVNACVAEAGLPNLSIDPDKTLYLSKKHHREITGLFVTPQGNVSLGRDRKRMLKSLVHRALLDKLDQEERGRLAGYINWAASVEPTFLETLERKYGRTPVANLRK